MDAVHVFLSGESFSTKVISIKDLILSLAVVVTGFLLSVCLRFFKGFRDSLSTGGSGQYPREIKPRQSIAHVAATLNTVIESMAHSQYILKDKVHYASVYQTPLRDSLQTLRSLSYELCQNTHYQVQPLQLANQSSGKSAALINTISTHQVLHDILPALKDYAEREGITLSVVELAHGYMQLSNGVVDKMLRELLLNAIKHNPKHCTIQLTCSFTSTHAIFEVADNGVGLTADVVSHALGRDPLNAAIRNRRLSDAETQVNLKSIALLARSINADLDIRTARTWGTTVRLLLPACHVVARPVYRQFQCQGARAIKAHEKRKKVLYVSKQAFVTQALYEHFDNHYKLYVYSSFDQALLALHDIEPDLVIADFSWHHALGIQFCEFLRGGSLTANVPFINLTLALDQATRVRMYASGVSAIVEKPLDPQELITIVDNLVSNQSTFADEVREALVNYSVDSMEPEDSVNSCNFISAFAEVVQANFHREEFNRHEAAQLMHMSERTLQRRLNKHVDMTFRQYLSKFRLEQARKKLLAGQYITEVTFDVGFNSTSYFGQCFKREFGYPPSMLSKATS